MDLVAARSPSRTSSSRSRTPRQFVASLIDLDTWRNDPWRAAGRLLPDLALALYTGGTVTAAVRGARAGSQVSMPAAFRGAVAGGARATWANSTLVTASRAMSTSVSGFWNGRVLAHYWADDRGSIRFGPIQADATPRYVKPGYEPTGRWSHPDARQGWMDELQRSDDRRVVNTGADWMEYQRRVAGSEEYRLRTADTRIWADGVHVDADGVAAIDAKYTSGGSSSLYEGTAPAFLARDAMEKFDAEMSRCAAVIRDEGNPVARLRIYTPTEAAAGYLGNRARQVLGPEVDLEVVVEP